MTLQLVEIKRNECTCSGALALYNSEAVVDPETPPLVGTGDSIVVIYRGDHSSLKGLGLHYPDPCRFFLWQLQTHLHFFQMDLNGICPQRFFAGFENSVPNPSSNRALSALTGGSPHCLGSSVQLLSSHCFTGLVRTAQLLCGSTPLQGLLDVYSGHTQLSHPPSKTPMVSDRD